MTEEYLVGLAERRTKHFREVYRVRGAGWYPGEGTLHYNLHRAVQSVVKEQFHIDRRGREPFTDDPAEDDPEHAESESPAGDDPAAPPPRAPLRLYRPQVKECRHAARNGG